ncbi:MAG: TonB-dependent receptor family protein, partial [Lutibacter sp.]|nr:TonB-dependent receptor family protein [Lutibacter sp.]
DKYSGYDLNDNRYGGGLNVVYNKNNVSYYGGINYNKKNVNGDRTGEARVLVKDPKGEYFHMDAAGERPEWYEYYSANAGIDIALKNNDKLSFSYFYGNRTAGRSAFYVYNNYYANADKSNKDVASEDWVYNPNTDVRKGEYHTINADYSIDLTETSNLKIAASYENSSLDRELNNKNYDYNSTTDMASSTIRTNQEYGLSDSTPLKGFRLSADFSKKLSETSTLGVGLITNYVNIAGDFKFQNSVVTKNLDNSIDLDRGVYASYVDFSGKAGKLNYIVGLRAEYQDQQMDVTNTDYLSLFNNTGKSTYENNKVDVFPSAHLSYAISEKDNVTAAASRRVNRPSVTSMSPFLYRRHLEVYEVGDPELEAEYLNNVEVTYDTKIGKNNISLTGFYRGTENAVFRVNTTTTNVQNPAVYSILNEDVLIRSYTNAGNSTAVGAELNATVYASSFAKLFVGGSLYNYTVKGDVFGYAVDNSSTNWSLKGNLNLDLTSQLKFNIDYNIKSRSITSQGRNDQFSSSNIAFNYKPKNLAGWDFSLRVLDIFQNNVEGLDTNAYNNQNEQIFYQVTDYYREGMIAELGVSYAFNMKGKTKKEKAVEGEKHFK